jgi:hypothetical protein
MIVICVNDDWYYPDGYVPQFPLPKIDCEYHVNEYNSIGEDVYYILDGFPRNVGFNSLNFTVPDDLNERLQEEVNQIVKIEILEPCQN